MNTEKLKKFLVPLLLILVALFALFKLGTKISADVKTYIGQKSELETKTTSLQEKKDKLESIQRKEAEDKRKAEENAKEEEKQIYKPIISGMDTEAVIAGEFSEILKLIRDNKIKVRTIKYDYNPQDDAFVKGAAPSFSVARLNMEIITGYTSFENFLKELYKHEHFLDIQSMEMVPYKKNKSILLINFKLKLYAQK